MARRGRDEGSVFQRKDGRWVARLTLESGKRKDIYGAKNKSEAKSLLKKAMLDQEQGVLVAGPSYPLGRYLEWWLDHVAKQSVRQRTYECYALCSKRIEPHLGKVRLSALTPAHVQTMYAALLEQGLSRRTVELTHAVLHRALKDALHLGMLGRNPTEAVSVPRPQRREMQTLSREQVQMLFAATKDERLHALWVLLATTGLRLGESLGLKWADVNVTASEATIQRALQYRKATGFELVEPKTKRSRRTVVLAPSTLAALKEHRRRQIEERLVAGPAWQDHELVFCREDGTPLNATGTVTHAFHRALRLAGLPKVRIHDLRHTAATLLLGEGVHPKKVQDLLGHSTITLTLDTYSHVVPGMHEETAEKMEKLFGNG